MNFKSIDAYVACFLLLFSSFILPSAHAKTTQSKKFISKKRALNFAQRIESLGFDVLKKKQTRMIPWHYFFLDLSKSGTKLFEVQSLLRKKNIRHRIFRKRKIVLLWRRPYPIPSDERAGIVTKLGSFSDYLREHQNLKETTVFAVIVNKQETTDQAFESFLGSENHGDGGEESMILNPTNDGESIVLNSPGQTSDFSKKSILDFEDNRAKRYSGSVLSFPQFQYQNGDSLYPFVGKIKYSRLISKRQEISIGAVVISNLEKASETYFDAYSLYYALQTESLKLTLGSQVISWGRVFENSLIDRFNRQTLDFGLLPSLQERSLNQVGARLELYKGDLKADLVLIPFFRGHRFQELNSPWALVDQTDGDFVFLPPNDPNDTVSTLVSQGSFDFSDPDRFAGGLRLSKDFSRLSVGLSFVRASQLSPYIFINPSILAGLSQGESAQDALENSQEATFYGVHPTTNLIATDGLLETKFGIGRFEFGFEDGTPTTTESFEFNLANSLQWNLSWELFARGEKDTFNIMYSGAHIQSKEQILDFADSHYVSLRYLMELNKLFSILEFIGQMGLHAHDNYFSLQWRYKRLEPYILKLGVEYFDGEAFTPGRFFNRYSNLSVGLKLNF